MVSWESKPPIKTFPQFTLNNLQGLDRFINVIQVLSCLIRKKSLGNVGKLAMTACRHVSWWKEQSFPVTSQVVFLFYHSDLPMSTFLPMQKLCFLKWTLSVLQPMSLVPISGHFRSVFDLRNLGLSTSPNRDRDFGIDSVITLQLYFCQRAKVYE